MWIKQNPTFPIQRKRPVLLLQRKTTTIQQLVSEDTLSQNISGEYQLKEKHYFDVLDNRGKGRSIKTSTRQLQNSSRDSYEFMCSCGKAITHNKAMSNSSKSATNYLRNERLRDSKVRFSVALPIKQFPPINPLQEMKKQNFLARRKQEVLLTRTRPHTVDTARLSRGIILVNGHHNLPNFRNAIQPAFDSQYCGQRGTQSSLENLNKEAQIFAARGKSEQNLRTGCNRLDEERKSEGRFGRHRSLSEPRATVKPSSKDLGQNGHSLYRDSVECFTGNRRRVKTPYSLNSEDNDSNTDSNDTGLGSEIEYCFDGLAKLDVYLQPRSTSFHDH